jgi:branched-chain amino acid transport system permease protein
MDNAVAKGYALFVKGTNESVLKAKLSGNALGFVVALVLLFIIGAAELAQAGTLARLSGGLLTVDMMSRVGMFTIVLIGLNLLMGYAGQVSLGQAAFYGMGAFFSAIFTARASQLGIPVFLSQAWWWAWIVMIAGMAFTGGVAYLVGLPVLRLRGHYLAMATLGTGIVVFVLLRENLGLPQMNLTGGLDGISAIPRLRVGDFTIWPVERYFVMVWLVAIIVIGFGLNIVHSRYGRMLRAIHKSETGAESVGIAVPKYKAQIFALSAALASLAGSLYAHFQSTVVPATFGFGPSLDLVVMSAVGGMASIWGAPFGAFSILLLQEILRTQIRVVFPNLGGEYEAVAFGIILVLIMIFMPEGLTARVVMWAKAGEKE